MLNNSFRRLLVVTAVTPANAVRRILCLHYSGGSAVPFVTRAAGPLRGAAASKYRDGRGAFWEFEGIDAPNGDGVWWEYEGQWSDDSRRSFNVERYEGADESIAVVEQQLSTGRFSGLMGLGQGALLAAIVAARAALGETSVPSSLQFAIICGGATPMPFKPLLTRLRDTADAGLPTLHCLSAADANHPAELGEELASYFEPHAKLSWHSAGSALPPTASAEWPEWRDQVVAFITRHESGPDVR